jgi:hypothetical protein
MWWDLLIVLGAGILAGWLALLIALVLSRPKGPLLAEAVRLLPDLLRLLRRLAADNTLPRVVRVRLALLMVYLALPVDLIPDSCRSSATPMMRSSSRSCCAAWCGGPGSRPYARTGRAPKPASPPWLA